MVVLAAIVESAATAEAAEGAAAAGTRKGFAVGAAAIAGEAVA
jgi:hypothetical protein